MNERTVMLIDKDKHLDITSKKIAIFGVGGVGGYVLEALVRSGFKYFDIYDFDVISISNLNRQIISNISNIGLSKVEEASNRAHSINPACIINANNLFIDSNTINSIDFTKFDYVVDCIDTVTSKMLIIKKCYESNIKVISSMGTGNKLDPSKLLISKIEKTSYCPLAKVIRYNCRKENIKNLTVLYSKEIPIKTNTRTPGSMIFVPASAGLLIASFIFRELLGELDV